MNNKITREHKNVAATTDKRMFVGEDGNFFESYLPALFHKGEKVIITRGGENLCFDEEEKALERAEKVCKDIRYIASQDK